MKKILLLVVVCCAMLVSRAQRVFFIYVQTDNKSAFYFKTGDKVYSSTAGGYLIVPRLVDSTYHVVIGKPGGGEARFTIPINGKDKGFLLRENGQKLSLFDLQTLTLLEPSATDSAPVSFTQKTDRFTTLLAQAADDPSLLQVAVVTTTDKPKKEAKTTEAVAVAPPVAEAETKAAGQTEAKGEVVQIETPPAKDTQAIVAQAIVPEKKDTTATVAAEKETVNKEEEVVAKTETKPAEVKAAKPEPAVVKEPVGEESVYKRSVVTRRAESSTSEGFGLLFTDSVDGVVDTIRLMIPNPKTVFLAEAEEPVKEDKRFLDLPIESPKQEVAAKETEKDEVRKRGSLFGKRGKNKEEVEVKEPVAKKQPVAKKETEAKSEEGCRNNASDGDVARLRRNMVGKASEEDMIGEGQKYFKSRCFTTQQIKGLSSLLLTSAGRYQFFEAAYNHVSDKEKFYTLQNELWDRADINRFKALLAK